MFQFRIFFYWIKMNLDFFFTCIGQILKNICIQIFSQTMMNLLPLFLSTFYPSSVDDHINYAHLSL